MPRSSAKPLPRRFYARDTVTVARELLGHRLVHGDMHVRIVETEAYIGPEDLACHAVGGRRTARNEVMYGPPGHTYVYFIYGMYYCLNIVTREAGFPAAVLIRAGEPGAKGPGVLCRELGISRAHNGLDVTDPASELRIERGPEPEEEIAEGPRVGVDYSGEWAQKPLRFWLKGNVWVSRKR
ncbi:MAG TPA: DNA-3-methyladenine glycosylase [Chloroflexota bacterium]|nr:DNA-3-methyladenine glycosylase [Chloroflexota bacterium]